MNCWSRLRRRCACGLIGLACVLGIGLSPARAQEEEPAAQGGGGGESWYGYAAFGVVAGMALFIVCKSARRST